MSDLSPLLAVRDMKKSVEFYTAGLGFELGMVFPDIETPEYADLSKDGMVLMIIPAKNHGISTGEQFGIGVTLYMHIEGDIDEYYQNLQKNGVRFIEDIKDEPYGVRDFTIEDPDGYRIAFTRVTARQCLSCGMTMNRPEDFGGGNPANPFCVHCTNPDGSLKKYAEVLEGLAEFMMATQNMDRDTAEKKARGYLAGMPAWEGENQ